jgi:hypothetical protein
MEAATSSRYVDGMAADTERVLEGRTSDDDWVVIFHQVRSFWPDLVVHRVRSGDAMIYEGQRAFRSGLAGEDAGHRLHVVVEPDRVTVSAPERSDEFAWRLFEVLRGYRRG